MLNKNLGYLCVACLEFFAAGSYANDTNRNPASIEKVIQLIDAKLAALDIQSSNTVGQQTQGGVVVWLDQSKRAGIVAALEDDPDFIDANKYFPAPQRLGAYSEYGMGGGYQNTVATLAVAGVNDFGSSYGAGRAALFVTNAAGESTTANCTVGVTSGSNACLGGWHVPNVGEFLAMFVALCNTSYALTTGSMKYWTSTSDASQPDNVFAVNVPSNHNCDVSNLTITSEAPNQEASTGFVIRYIRGFG
ncbi:MAG: hypothetical protein K0U37_03890 [Gammaproteobacteria bacterium]|nr:hypothetical protein [Gammaproteobacteria bacterium]